MSRAALVLALLALASPSACTMPGVVVLDAQTLPLTRTVSWDPNPVADEVTSYTVRLDGALVGMPTATTQVVTFLTAGPHTVTLVATNVWGDSLPATLLVTIKVPTAPGRLKLTP